MFGVPILPCQPGLGHVILALTSRASVRWTGKGSLAEELDDLRRDQVVHGIGRVAIVQPQIFVDGNTADGVEVVERAGPAKTFLVSGRTQLRRREYGDSPLIDGTEPGGVGQARRLGKGFGIVQGQREEPVGVELEHGRFGKSRRQVDGQMFEAEVEQANVPCHGGAKFVRLVE